jgi:hypothetical protein
MHWMKRGFHTIRDFLDFFFKGVYFWLFRPFKIISVIKFQFLIFCVFTLVGGHFGIVASFFASRSEVEAWNFLGGQFQSGVFYNLAIAFLFSAIVPIWLEPIDKESPSFPGVKQFALAFSFLVICFSLILLATAGNRSASTANLAFQVLFYIVSVYLTIYLFILQYLHQFKEDFAEMDNQRRDQLAAASPAAISDDRGISL